MSDTNDDDVDTRKIEKRRSWSQITSSVSSVSASSNDDYAIELDLFERGEIDKSLWAKHLVETKGNEEEAKWLYIKERVTTESARRAEQERVKAQEEERRRRIAEQKAAEEAERKANEQREENARKDSDADEENDDVAFALIWVLLALVILCVAIIVAAVP